MAVKMNRKKPEHSASCLQKVSWAITGSMETFFYNWGYNVAKHPYLFICGCLVLTASCGIGLINFSPENRPDRLWIPRNSEFVKDTEWLRKTFPSPIRSSMVILAAENILEPEMLKMILSIHEQVKEITIEGKKWQDICLKLPITKFEGKKKKRRRRRRHLNSTSQKLSLFGDTFVNFEDDFEDDFFQAESDKSDVSSYFDPSVSLPDELYCSIITNLDEACYETNILELWSYDPSTINNLTSQEILNTIHTVFVSPIFGRTVNYTAELGGLEMNDEGQVIKAKSIILRWAVRINQTVVENGDALSDMGTGEIVDETTLLWEKAWVEVLEKFDKPPGVELYFGTGRSWGDISQDTIMGDAGMMAAGFTIVFIYVVFMLGRFNKIEQRPFLSLAGLTCVGLAIIVSYGICSAFKLMYGPVNKILPFLLLGIGIDDMFVIMQCWNNMLPSERKRSLPERMGLTLKHAGVSITVTSLTDVAAFGIGATTVLPGLQSFCVFAAFGIIAVYIFQATFFVAWFALDQERLENRRHAFLFCCKTESEDYKSNECSQYNLAQLFFEKVFSKYIFTKKAKLMVLALTAFFLGVNIYGNTQLRQEFDPMWFLPEDSYLTQYLLARDKYFPGRGYPAFLILENINWTASMPEFDELMANFESQDAIYNIDSWYTDFKEYVNRNYKVDIPGKEISAQKFQKYMGRFLFSPTGSKYRAFFKVNGRLACGESLPTIELSLIPFRFRKFSGPEEHIPAMHEIKHLVRNSNLTFNRNETGHVFPWTTAFVAWETDEIITVELFRNVALSLLCVLVTTLILLANLRMCIFCGICVIFTLVDVGGLMHFWGLTIDTVSCIDIVLAIGLCVDYAAHIGLAFMTCTGSRDERAKQALTNIGPAVLNGGFSTFLAFILLANSKSHVFRTFFKIFFLVVGFGLFHGLVFLPVLLSVFGPDPYPSAYIRTDTKDNGVELCPLHLNGNKSKLNNNISNGVVVSAPAVLYAEQEMVPLSIISS